MATANSSIKFAEFQNKLGAVQINLQQNIICFFSDIGPIFFWYWTQFNLYKIKTRMRQWMKKILLVMMYPLVDLLQYATYKCFICVYRTVKKKSARVFNLKYFFQLFFLYYRQLHSVYKNILIGICLMICL